MSARYTPTPWFVKDTTGQTLDASRFQNGAFQIYSSDCENHAVADCSANHTCRDASECAANAAFIVHAVNCHDELVAALFKIVERSHADHIGTSKVIDMRKIALSAIAKAKPLATDDTSCNKPSEEAITEKDLPY